MGKLVNKVKRLIVSKISFPYGFKINLDNIFKVLRTKTYFLSELKMNWIGASLTCQSYGMSLCLFDSYSDWSRMQSIYNQFKSDFEWLTWFGGTKLGSG